MDVGKSTDKMQITILEETQKKMNTIWLPAGEAKGRYTLEAYGIPDFFIEGYKGGWMAVCRGSSFIANCKDDYRYCVPLEDGQFLRIESEKRNYALFVDRDSEDSGVFLKYSIGEAVQELTIGRHRDNDICIPGPMVSGYHAVLKRAGGSWVIFDRGSTNGTFLNCRRITKETLSCGDVLYLMGVKIVMGPGFLALDRGGKKVELNPVKFLPVNEIKGNAQTAGGTEEEVLFNRLPRRRMSLQFEEIRLEAPPMSMKSNNMPFLLRSGSSMVMGATALATGRFTSVITSLLFPFLTHGYTEKERKEYEDRRRSLYHTYLQKKAQQIESERSREEFTLKWNYPDLNEVLRIPAEGRRLWERKKLDDDFLSVRIGVGERNLMTELTYPQEQLSMEEDDLETEMRRLAEQPVKLRDVPIQTSLVEDFVCGVAGRYSERVKFVRNFIYQLVITHSYDEVKLIFLANENTMEEFRFVRYLPHVWNDERNFRFVAGNSSQAGSIGEYLQKELENAEDEKLEEALKNRPFYVIVAFDKKCLDTIEVLKNLIQDRENHGVALMAAYPDLPKECSKIFQLHKAQENEVLYLRELDRSSDKFHLDECDVRLAEQADDILANTKLKTVEQAYALPKMLTFLQMYGVDKIAYLNVENRWKNSNPVQSLAAPVGVATDGSLFMLDLHQKFQGPHGLVAGTTGSGKSEFLMTYILSMAVNYHPDEVAFVLIDYKGGGLAGAFDDPEHGVHLPHLVGTITNLDGSSIQRSLISIQSELIRRQKIFQEVKNVTGEGTMDIYMYQKAYRNGLVKEPMPHLFIISDEFAELKQQEPEFMDKLISAARIGRSLGIHLILATQKPSGVVNDQIRSNTKFRVCLKVQDKADSNDMLKRPEAAELKDTGRFYLQVGYNEFFALGQSAWSGADYIPEGRSRAHNDEMVQIIDETGIGVTEIRKKAAEGTKRGSQLVSIVRYISDIAGKEHVKVRQLWKPAISEYLKYEKLNAERIPENGNGIYAVTGMVDDPENQAQFPMRIDLQTGGNLLVMGESGCGKSTFLQTMLYDLTSRYTPELVQYYLIDCSGHRLRVFRDAPHCGAWLSEDREADIDRLFGLLKQQIRQRKRLFVQEDVAGYEMYVRRKPLPLLIYVIDNMAGLTATSKGSEYFSSISSYMKESSGLGIRFVITASHMNELYTKSKQELGARIALEQKDKYTYGDVLNEKCDYVPPRNKGHGAVCVDGRVLEFQTAIVPEPEQDNEDVKRMVDTICEAYVASRGAERLPVLDPEQEYETFARTFAAGRIPLGYSLRDIKPVALPLKQMSMLSVYLGNPAGNKAFFQNMIVAAKHNAMDVVALTRRKGSGMEAFYDGANITTVACDEKSIREFIMDMTAKAVPRIETLQTYTRANGLKASDKDIYKETYAYMSKQVTPVLVLVECFADLCEALSADENDQALARLMEISRNLCIYYVAGFYPGDKTNRAYAAYKVFNPEKVELYLGGQYNRQMMGTLPGEFTQVEKIQPYNKGIMRYKDKYYALFMPCGPVAADECDEDDKDIFE